MALPISGVMKASMIRAELGETGTWRINSTSSRNLAKVPSGRIKFSDFYGKAKESISTAEWVDHPSNYWNDGMRTPATSISRQYTFSLSNIASNIMIAFRYSMMLSHEFNKGGSDSIYGADWKGSPNNASKVEFYRNQNNVIGGASDPGVFNKSSYQNIKNSAHWVIEVNTSSLTSSLQSVYHRYFEDDRKVRGTNLNIYVSRSGNNITVKETYEFSKYKSDRHNLRLNRWSRCIVASANLYYKLAGMVKYVFMEVV